LEVDLASKGKEAELERLRDLQSMARIQYVWQSKMGGLGDAVGYARAFVGDEPFAVLLGDTVVSSEGAKPVVRQLAEVVEKYGGSCIALQEVPAEKVSRYGIMGGDEVEPGLIKATQFVEKPTPEQAPSRLAVSARYVLSPEVFDVLDQTATGKGGEVQLTDALAMLMQVEPLFGLKYAGRRHDIGNKLDFIKANVDFALEREDIGPALRSWLQQRLVS
jgi:UTP--glucose-1-phosphate uridylyltransferase